MCRAKAIQKLLEKLNTPQQISLVVTSLIPGAFALSIDSNGQHIINYCVKRFPGEYTKVIGMNVLINVLFLQTWLLDIDLQTWMLVLLFKCSALLL